ncbi:MAG: lipid-A-disaccharide synthase [candidate division Zixibacteria bacterium CG_4_9_14_3_um_filter_46_8]|nr:MAG: lipid-A-disaccharide synthase [candidate division Zixibacteria bacterium CG_4_9_14_3_um_filter_46_8]
MPYRIYISAGEASGDMHGGGLAGALRGAFPDLVISGMGGDRMRSAGVEVIEDYRQYAIMGFVGVIANLHRFSRLLKRVVKHIREERVNLVVLIDYSGFNLRLARAANRLGVKVVYFISPQVWAWRTGRVKDIKRYVDRMITIFPFEKEFYRRYGIDADYIGHPLLDEIPSLDEEQRKAEVQRFRLAHQINGKSPILGLFPGSRAKEIEKMLPTMLCTAAMLRRDIPTLNILIARAPNIDLGRHMSLAEFGWIQSLVVDNDTAGVLLASDAVLVSSGTTTVEAALHGTPQVVMYKTSWLTYRIARACVKVDYIAMVNLIAAKRIVPEFIQDEAQPERLRDELYPLLTDNGARRAARQASLEIRKLLGEKGAYQRAADIAAHYIGNC